MWSSQSGQNISGRSLSQPERRKAVWSFAGGERAQTRFSDHLRKPLSLISLNGGAVFLSPSISRAGEPTSLLVVDHCVVPIGRAVEHPATVAFPRDDNLGPHGSLFKCEVLEDRVQVVIRECFKGVGRHSRVSSLYKSICNTQSVLFSC